jgi:sec-independent protein translocase protein TatC
MTFGEHLEELRRRLMVGILAFAVAFAAAFAFQDQLVVFFSQPFERARAEINVDLAAKWSEKRKADPGLAPALDQVVELLRTKGVFDDPDIARLRPLLERDGKLTAPHLPPLQALTPFETFTSYMFVCLLTALVIAGPVLLHQLWQFVAAGLYQHERKSVVRMLPVSFALFFLGLAFGYAVLAKLSVQFLISYGDLATVQPQVTISSYLGLLLLLLLVMGLTFQIPLVMTVLASTGLVGPGFYKGKRRICVLVIFIVAAIITPPDAVSQCLVAGPMLVLFEIGLLMAKVATKKREQRQRDEAARPPTKDDAAAETAKPPASDDKKEGAVP